MRLITSEDVAVIDCNDIEINPYCQVLARGMNISCYECKKRHLWEKFWRQDKKGGKHYGN